MADEIKIDGAELPKKLKTRRKKEAPVVEDLEEGVDLVEAVEAVSDKQETEVDEDRLIMVEAKSVGRDDRVAGFYGNHTRYVGDKFEVLERHFSTTWMLKV